jgi:peptidoglycan/LPS O-acetylase OafA/YrhL
VSAVRATRPPPVHALTGIRFFAAVHVVIYHYAGGALATAPSWLKAIVACGPSAVGLFYILSGAVLVYSCTNDDGALNSSRAWFWRARFARIYPIYLFALFLDAPFFASALFKLHDGLGVVLWGIALGIPVLLLLHAWIPLTVFAWNTPGWSLSNEGFFYALFPSLTRRLQTASTGQLFRRGAMFYALALLAPLAVLAAQRFGGSGLEVRVPAGAGGLDLNTWIVRFAGFSPIARLPEFLIGICLGHWLKTRRGTWSPFNAGVLELAAVGGLVIAWIGLGSYPQQTKIWLDSGLLAPLFALIVAALTVGTGPMARVLSTAPLVILGDASYALYILQEPVVIWTAKLPIIGLLAPWLSFSIYLIIVIGASIVCQRFGAEPVRRWLLRSRDSSRVPALQPAQGL